MHTTPHTLEGWLRHCEQIHPVGIDMGLERVREVAHRMALKFNCPVITVAGTNGKGSTCAMLEAVALQAGYRTGVYTSPHLVHFQERCRVHGEIVSPADLLPHFEAVEKARTQGGDEVSLTYFEFTTLAILRLMSHSLLDVAILEVGLGGRLDATNVIDADCAIITSIDIDHVEFLGPDRESIGREKAGIMRTGRPAIVSDPMAPQSVVDHAREIGADLWRVGHDFNVGGDKQQWNWAGRGRRYAGLAYPALRGANQLVNAAGVLAAFEALRDKLPVTAQAVRNGMAMVDCPGVSKSCPASQPWCWMLPTTRTLWLRSRPIWTPWATTRSPTRCLARWLIKTWGLCLGRLAPWWIAGISPVCLPPGRCRGPSFSRNGMPCTWSREAART